MFGFDLEKNEVRFSFNLKEAIGTTNSQGTEDVAVVQVSSDGTQIEVYNSANPEVAHYIQQATLPTKRRTTKNSNIPLTQAHTKAIWANYSAKIPLVL